MRIKEKQYGKNAVIRSILITFANNFIQTSICL